MRVLVVSNMYPTLDRPALGRFVRDQVEALTRIDGLALELFTFCGEGTAGAYGRAAAELRRRFGTRHFDVVHSHFGLSLWPALAVRAGRRAVTLHGTDLAHPRSRRLTLAGLRTQNLVATVSEELGRQVPGRALARGSGRAVLPCGVDLRRFRRLDRKASRRELGLAPDGPYLLFPADPARAEKRYDRALAVAGGVPLLALSGVDPEAVPLWVNAANAVLVPSEREGFGLACLEALACDVPVLSTPVGVAPAALDGVRGTLCAPFNPQTWRAAVGPHLSTDDPRVAGARVAERYSADRLAEAVATAWRGLLPA